MDTIARPQGRKHCARLSKTHGMIGTAAWIALLVAPAPAMAGDSELHATGEQLIMPVSVNIAEITPAGAALADVEATASLPGVQPAVALDLPSNLPVEAVAAVPDSSDIVVEAPAPTPPKWDSRYVPVDQIDAYELHVRKEARRAEVAYLAASAVDAVATISCVARNRCTERNPLMLKGKPIPMLLVKGALSAVHLFGFNKLLDVNPASARAVARASLVLQGIFTGIGIAANF